MPIKSVIIDDIHYTKFITFNINTYVLFCFLFFSICHAEILVRLIHLYVLYAVKFSIIQSQNRLSKDSPVSRQKYETVTIVEDFKNPLHATRATNWLSKECNRQSGQAKNATAKVAKQTMRSPKWPSEQCNRQSGQAKNAIAKVAKQTMRSPKWPRKECSHQSGQAKNAVAIMAKRRMQSPKKPSKQCIR